MKQINNTRARRGVLRSSLFILVPFLTVTLLSLAVVEPDQYYWPVRIGLLALILAGIGVGYWMARRKDIAADAQDLKVEEARNASIEREQKRRQRAWDEQRRRQMQESVARRNPDSALGQIAEHHLQNPARRFAPTRPTLAPSGPFMENRCRVHGGNVAERFCVECRRLARLEQARRQQDEGDIAEARRRRQQDDSDPGFMTGVATGVILDELFRSHQPDPAPSPPPFESGRGGDYSGGGASGGWEERTPSPSPAPAYEPPPPPPAPAPSYDPPAPSPSPSPDSGSNYSADY